MKTRLLLLFLLLLPFATSAHADPGGKWEQIARDDGVTVFSKEVEGSDLVAFKGETTIKQPLAKVLSVLMDNPRRTEWVDRLLVSKDLKKISDHEFIIYPSFGLPVFISDRDYVYLGKATRNAEGHVTLDMRSCDYEGAPETVGVRATLIHSRYVLIPKGETQTTVVVEIQTNPNGLIPAWLVNQIQKNWPAKTLQGVRLQAQRKDVKPYPLPPLDEVKEASK